MSISESRKVDGLFLRTLLQQYKSDQISCEEVIVILLELIEEESERQYKLGIFYESFSRV